MIGRTSAVILNGAGGNGLAKPPRWLRFDFSADNKQTLKILADTHIRVGDTIVHFDEDTSFDLSETINAETSPNGKDWYVFLDTEGHVTCSLSKVEATGTKRIGQFHTLCVGAGATLSGQLAGASSANTVGEDYLIKQYSSGEDPDFYNFYNKEITAVTTGTIYDVVTVDHPLKGFATGDILPESVWCLTFKPYSSGDGMVYDVDIDMAVDIYLQSGTGKNTKSAYGGTITNTRAHMNHQDDMRQVRKRLLYDSEFTSIALGSNEKTNIAGSVSGVTAGGHSDTVSRRMISFIGVEEACGHFWQWCEDVGAAGGSVDSVYDGNGAFGKMYGTCYGLLLGGGWGSAAGCGSRGRDAYDARSSANAGIGGAVRAEFSAERRTINAKLSKTSN